MFISGGTKYISFHLLHTDISNLTSGSATGQLTGSVRAAGATANLEDSWKMVYCHIVGNPSCGLMRILSVYRLSLIQMSSKKLEPFKQKSKAVRMKLEECSICLVPYTVH